MDVPIKLTANSTFITGVDELKQDIFLILKEPIGSWYQSAKTGSYVGLHSSDESMLRESVQDTLMQIKGIKVDSVQVSGDSVLVRINYNGRELEEIFNINEE